MKAWVGQMLRIAAQRPEHPAVVMDNAIITYGEFAARVRQMAAAFTPYLEKAETKAVAIALPQSADAYGAMFATLMAGGFYVPLNLASPPVKLAYVLEQVKPTVVITESSRKSQLPLNGLPCLTTDALGDDRLNDIKMPHRLAYIMFTSGSTGNPKGVMISQDAMRHYVDWVHKDFAPTPQDRWSQHPNIAFDVSVTDIYGALCSGGTLFPVTGEKDRLVPADFIRRHGITIWNSVPSVVNLMIRAKHVTQDMLGSVRLFNFLGEPLLPEQVEVLFTARPDTIIQNTYGPTEATVSCTAVRMNANDWKKASHHTITLGPAIPDMQLHLENGELVLTGPQLADGYWQNAEKTGAAFQTFKIGNEQVRGYRTGDLVEYMNGLPYFLARKDRQVKINGYRVELEEVNAAMRKSGYLECACGMVSGALHGFVETPQPETFDAGALKEKLQGYLEHYAIPTHFHAYARLPRNANDKIDAGAMMEKIRMQGNNT